MNLKTKIIAKYINSKIINIKIKKIQKSIIQNDKTTINNNKHNMTRIYRLVISSPVLACNLYCL